MKEVKYIFRFFCLLTVFLQISYLITTNISFLKNQKSEDIEISLDSSDDSEFESDDDSNDEILIFLFYSNLSENLISELTFSKKNVITFYINSISNPEISTHYSPPESKI